MTTRVKICGITNLDDALAAVRLGAHALGFIGVKSSPRYVSDEQVDDIIAALPPFVHTVAVVQRAWEAEDYTCGMVQYYEDDESDSRLRWHAGRRIRSFRIKDAASVQELATYQNPVGAYHLDAYHKDKLGGSGETFNWDLAIQAKSVTDKPIILAGGLTPENVADAIRTVRPYAVDLSSGVESEPGKKDIEKLTAFFRAVQDADRL